MRRARVRQTLLRSAPSCAPARSRSRRQTPQSGQPHPARARRGRRRRAESIASMSAIEDYANYYRLMPNFGASRVHCSRRGDQGAALRSGQGAARFDAVCGRRWRVGAREAPPPARFIDARMTRGNLKTVRSGVAGHRAIGASQTLVAFELCADPDLPPRSARAWSATRTRRKRAAASARCASTSRAAPRARLTESPRLARGEAATPRLPRTRRAQTQAGARASPRARANRRHARSRPRRGGCPTSPG